MIIISKVAVLQTGPSSILGDYRKLLHLIDYNRRIPKRARILLKLNLSWTKFYPACSTSPWQLEGVAKTLIGDGYQDITAVEDQTVVTHPLKGAYNNKWLPILKESRILFKPLTNVEWVSYKPPPQVRVLRDMFGVIRIPKLYQGAWVIHLPTIKTHGHTTTTGAMKNAFGGLIPRNRHHAHSKIHDVLVDLLAIQQDIHKGILAVMDGGVCGNGAGPRTMKAFYANLILASVDQVAIDAVAARIMGFDPLKIPYIKRAHDLGLGNGDTEQIDIIGMKRSVFGRINHRCRVAKSPIIFWDQLIRKGTVNLPWLHNLLFHSPLFKAFILASMAYHDWIWYPSVGRYRIRQFLKSDWGACYRGYEHGKLPLDLEIRHWDPY